MPQKNENRASMKGEPKHEDRGQAKTIKSDEKVGSSDGHGIRFPVHNHHGMGEVDKGPSTP